MSGLNGKHLASDNQLLSGQPSRAPSGCAQLGGAAVPAEFTVNPAARFASQALGLQRSARRAVPKTSVQATAGGCLLFSHCFGGVLERDRQEGGTPFPATEVCRLLMSVRLMVVFFSKWKGMGGALAAG